MKKSDFISLGFFILVIVGIFMLFTQVYPPLIFRYRQQFQKLRQRPISTPTEEQIIADLLPFIRGTNLGEMVSHDQSLVSQLPISVNLIQGYKNGVIVADIARRDWFDLDRQLFRVQGAGDGMRVAKNFSVSEIGKGTFAYQTQLINTVQSVIQSNLEEFLIAAGSNRRSALEQYQKDLKKLASEVLSEIQILETSLADINLRISEFSDLVSSFEGDTTANTVPYLEARKNFEEARIQSVVPKQLLDSLKKLQPALDRLIAAIGENFEALSQGIKVTPKPGANIPIFKE